MSVEIATINCPTCPNWHRIRLTDDLTRFCPINGEPYSWAGGRAAVNGVRTVAGNYFWSDPLCLDDGEDE